MLSKISRTLIDQSKTIGWVLEPDAKAIMYDAGLDIPEFVLTPDIEEARAFFKKKGGPVVAKAVSQKILHKTEFNAVITHIDSDEMLKNSFESLLKLDGCRAVLVEEMINGVEIIVGGKNDYQFGPVVILGVGGTSVEIYNDTAIRMAPVKESDVGFMVESLKGKGLISGYRGQPGADLDELKRFMVTFSKLLMDLEEDLDSIDLNPVICTPERCIIADARIILT